MTNKKKIVAIVAVVIIVILIIVAVAVLYSTTNIFKSNEELFWTYISQNGDITSILENDKFAEQKEFKENQSYNSTGDATFSLSQGEDSTTSFNVATTARHDATTNRTYADATLKNGDLDIFTMSYIKSADEANGDVYALKASDVVDVYVGFRNTNLKELASKFSISTDRIPDTIDLDNYIEVLTLTEEQKSHIADTYFPVIQDMLSKDNYTKSNENIQINGSSYNANVYSVQMTADQFKEIINEELETLKEDTEMMVLISNKASTLNLGVDYTDITNLTIKINDLEEKINNMDIEGTIEISVYENYDQTIRTKISIENMIDITYDQSGNDQILTIDYTQGSLDELINDTDDETTLTEETEETEEGTDTENVQDTNIVLETPLSDATSSNTSIDQVSDLTTNDDEEESDVIDLDTANSVEITGTEDSEETADVTEIVITKTTTDEDTSNNIFIVDNINSDSSNSISITYDMSAVSENTLSNTYSIVEITNDEQPSSTKSVTYTTNTVAADQVDEIEELTDSNAVLANNDDYGADEFTTFFNNWLGQIKSIVTEKLSTLGVVIDDAEDSDDEAEEVQEDQDEATTNADSDSAESADDA